MIMIAKIGLILFSFDTLTPSFLRKIPKLKPKPYVNSIICHHIFTQKILSLGQIPHM